MRQRTNSAGAECEARNGAECGSEQGAESEVDCEVELVHVVWLCAAKSNWYMWCGFVCALRVAVASGGAACGVEGLKVNQWRTERGADCRRQRCLGWSMVGWSVVWLIGRLVG